MNTSLLRLRIAALLVITVLFAGKSAASTLSENFDTPSVASTSNNGVQITYPSGVWYTYGITKPTSATENDRINGLYSMRMRGLDGKNTMYMMFDKAGAGVLSFKYGSYGNYRNGEFTIQKSTDQGASWTTIGSAVTVPAWSGTFLTYSLPVNYNGNIRFKIVVTCRTPNNPNEQFNIDDLMITDFGTEQIAMPASNVATGVYETAQNVTLTSATQGATIYYTTNGTVPTTSSQVYSSPLNINTTTKISAYAVVAGKIDSRVEEVLISFPEPVATLAELTSKMAASGTNLTYFKYTGEAVISSFYSTSTTAAYGTTVTKYAFLQDNTAGISLKDNNKCLNTTYNTGDKVTNITGQVFNINNTVQLYPYSDFTIVSSNNTISPALVNLSTVNTKPYQLVQLNNVSFDGADGTKVFGVNNSVFLKETTVSTFPLRIPSNLTVAPDFQGTIIPTTPRNIVGIVSKAETSFTDYSLFVRSLADLNVPSAGIENLKSYNIYISGTTVSFETVAPESVKVFNVSGQLIKDFVSTNGKNSLELSRGVYVFRIGDKTVKVLL